MRSRIKADDHAAFVVAKELMLGDWFNWLVENEWPESIDEKTLRDQVSHYKKYAAARWDNVPSRRLILSM